MINKHRNWFKKKKGNLLAKRKRKTSKVDDVIIICIVNDYMSRNHAIIIIITLKISPQVSDMIGHKGKYYIKLKINTFPKAKTS